MHRLCSTVLAVLILATGGIMTIQAASSAEAASQSSSKAITLDDARKFIEAAEAKLVDIWVRASRAQWVQQTFITHDTELMSAQADQVVKATTADLARSEEHTS